MEITEVHYQKLVNLGDYQNERVGAWANVRASDTPESALQDLKFWVESQLHATKELSATVATLQQDIYDLAGRKQQLERESNEMRKIWEKQRAFLNGLGLELPRSYVPADDDIPF